MDKTECAMILGGGGLIVTAYAVYVISNVIAGEPVPDGIAFTALTNLVMAPIIYVLSKRRAEKKIIAG